MTNTIQLYPSRTHLLTQKPVWVKFNLPDVPDIEDWYIGFTEHAERKSIEATEIVSDYDMTKVKAALRVPNISANCVPYTVSITPDTAILGITKEYHEPR